MIIDRFLCFNVGSEEFGIPILSVKEVLALPELTPVPFAPSHFVGIMNLRGQVISLVDLRSKFGIKSKENSESSVIICDLETSSIGVIVDSINSVICPNQDEILDKPHIQGNSNSDYITGIFRKEDRMVLILDVKLTLNFSDKSTSSKTELNKSNRKAS